MKLMACHFSEFKVLSTQSPLGFCIGSCHGDFQQKGRFDLPQRKLPVEKTGAPVIENMRVGLFIPCYVDQFFPEVGIATLQLLEKQGCEVVFPEKQTCCGQPMANTGMEQEDKKIYTDLAELFRDCEYIVGPSPSCVNHIREHYDIVEQTEAIRHLRKNSYDLVEFLVRYFEN